VTGVVVKEELAAVSVVVVVVVVVAFVEGNITDVKPLLGK